MLTEMNVFPFLFLLQRRQGAVEVLPPVTGSPFDRRMRLLIAALFCIAAVAAVVAQRFGFLR
jgi:hypothetical protein